jgi:subfamily B ATP-binding cassette protein MsbA
MKEILGLFKLSFREKKHLSLALLCSVGVAIFTSLFVNLVQPILDNMIKLAPDPSRIPQKKRVMTWVLQTLHIPEANVANYLPYLLLIVIFGKGLFTFLSNFFMKTVGHRVIKRLRDDLYRCIMYQSAPFFDRMTTGDLMSRLTSDVDKVREAISGSMADFIEELFVLMALLIGVFLIDIRLAVVAFVITPLAIIPLAVFSRQVKKKSLTGQKKMAQIYGLIHETVTGHRIVKAFTTEEFEIKKFLQATWSYLRTSIKLAWIGSLSSPFMEFLGGMIGAFILVVGSSRIAHGFISPGDFGAFVLAIIMMFNPINRINRANNVIQQAVASHSRIREILEAAPLIQDRPNAYPLPRIKGHVRFDNVTFGYHESRPALDNVDFEVEPAENIAIVGLSGAGKTTIINLLTRFYEPTSGRITIDGIDIRDVTIESLRSQIGLVTQDIILFNDTIRNNIAYGMKDMPLERVVEAARTARAHDFILALPQSYDTPIGERGGLLSNGQRQRLAIARALLKDPPILILDEATSALDNESERLIQTALSEIMKHRTTFVIAHRISTVRSADRILVIENGRIHESGSHDELCRINGVYKKLYDLQFPEEEENRP